MKIRINKLLSSVFIDYEEEVDKNKFPMFWDYSSLRPDISLYLQEDVEYPAEVEFELRMITDGNIIYIPAKIEIDNQEFINIRF